MGRSKERPLRELGWKARPSAALQGVPHVSGLLRTSRFGAVGDLHAPDGESGEPQDERGQEQQPESRSRTRGRSGRRRQQPDPKIAEDAITICVLAVGTSSASPVLTHEEAGYYMV
jgi:hypothetical protein